MDDDPTKPALAVLSHRARRLGLCFVGLGVLVALIFWSWFGAFLGVVIASSGLYMAYAYLPLAARIRRLEERRHSAP
jgi:hypothetical protein